MFSKNTILLGCLSLLAACSSYSNISAAPFPYVGMAPLAPPANLREAKPYIESPGDEIWMPGYWAYNGFSYSWVSGQLVDRPDPTAVWISPRWELRGYGWTFMPGHWQ